VLQEDIKNAGCNNGGLKCKNDIPRSDNDGPKSMKM